MNKSHLPDTTLLSELREILGDADELLPVVQGEESYVVGVRRGRDHFILRRNRDADGFRKDAFAHQAFASTRLPIPEIVSIGHLADGQAYCLSRRAIGRTLQDLTAAEIAAVPAAVAQTMTAIAESELSGGNDFGVFNASGVAPCASWREFLLQIDELDWRGNGLDHRVTQYLELIHKLIEHCPEERRLIHGDFGSNNVLTDGSRVTAVIDWSEALYGDPLYDVANILFWRPWLICMEAQARWFEAHRPALLQPAERLLCYQLHIGLKQAHASALSGNRADTAWALARCGTVAGR